MPIMDVTKSCKKYFDGIDYYVLGFYTKNEIVEWTKNNRLYISVTIQFSNIYYDKEKDNFIPLEPRVEYTNNLAKHFSFDRKQRRVDSITFEFDTQEDYNLFKLTWG